MNIPFFRKLGDAFNFTFKYKSLILFGFLLSLAAGFSIFNFDTGGNFDSEQVDRLESAVETGDFSVIFVEILTENLLLLVLLIVVGFIVGITLWYLSSIGRSALISLWRTHNLEGTVPTLKDGWQFGTKNALKFMLVDIVFSIPILIVLAIMSPLFFFGIATLFQSPDGNQVILGTLIIIIVVLCTVIPLLFLFASLIGLLKQVTERLMLLKQISPLAALAGSIGFTFRNIFSLFLAFLVTLLPAFLNSIIISVLNFVIGILLFVPLVFMTNPDNGFLFVGIVVAIGLFSSLINAIVSAPFSTLISNYWTDIVNTILLKTNSAGNSLK